jgi:hypothetical protein
MAAIALVDVIIHVLMSAVAFVMSLCFGWCQLMFFLLIITLLCCEIFVAAEA